jgi:hypothetical protein
MEKSRSSLTIITLLFILLVAWWFLSTHHFDEAISSAAPSMQNDISSSHPLIVEHSSMNNVDTYSGSLSVSQCDTLQTGISASGNMPPHLQVILNVLQSDQPCKAEHMTAEPFSVSVHAPSSTNPVLDSVLINNEAAAFSVQQQ